MKKHITKAYELLTGNDKGGRSSVREFADKFGLVYFKKVDGHLVHGVTQQVDQVDSDSAVGSHDGYDAVFVRRTTDEHTWNIIEFDLRHYKDAPFIFIGTHQQDKAFYTSLFTARRDVKKLEAGQHFEGAADFNSRYMIVSAPAYQPIIFRLLTDETLSKIAAYKEPFAVEIEGEKLSILTDDARINVKKLTKMLHYGIWLAREIDNKV